MRIEAAKKKLESTTMNIHQVMYHCGYSDDKTFRTLFKRYAGATDELIKEPDRVLESVTDDLLPESVIL